MPNNENLKTDQETVSETILHADEKLTEKSIVGLQTVNLETNLLLDVPNNIVNKIKSTNNQNKLNDTMFDLVLDYSEQTQEKGNARTLKKTGSVFTSIIITTITIAIGLITAIILTR